MMITTVECTGAEGADSALLELGTADGLVGLAPFPARLAHSVAGLGRALVLGEDARAAPALWESLRAAAGDHAVTDAAVAALDLALWDLKAKSDGLPLWRALGAAHGHTNVYATLPADTPAARLTLLCGRLASEAGIHQVKISGGIDVHEDLDRLRAAWEALYRPEREPVLMLEVGVGRNAKQISQHIQRLERDIDLTWVEDPRPAWDFLGLKRVVDAIRSAVCSGGSLGPEDFLPILHTGSANVVEIDLARTGITGALRVADAAHALEVPVTLAALPGNLHVHAGAVMPNLASLELADALLPPGVHASVRITDGRAVADHSPGLGLTLEGTP